jgi:hypothetical protein
MVPTRGRAQVWLAELHEKSRKPVPLSHRSPRGQTVGRRIQARPRPGGRMTPPSPSCQSCRPQGVSRGPLTLPPPLSDLFFLILSALSGNLAQFVTAFSPSRLAALCQRRLTPWLYREIMARHWGPHLPAEARQTLRHDYFVSLLAAQKQEREILRVIEALTRAAVEVILLKGAELRFRLYGDPAVRSMGDLDLLVSPIDFPRVAGTLSGLGYRLFMEHRLRPADWRGVGNELTYAPPAPLNLYVDVHWEITALCYYYRLPYEALRSAAVPFDAYGVPAWALSPEHTLIHLCLGAYEDFPSLPRLLDIVVLLNSQTVDWAAFLQAARAWRCQHPLKTILHLITSFLPRLVPRPVLAELGRYRPSLTERLILHPRLRFLTLGLPSFWRHGNLRGWLVFLRTDLFPRADRLTAAYGKPDRRANLRRVLHKLHGKLFPPKLPDVSPDD